MELLSCITSYISVLCVTFIIGKVTDKCIMVIWLKIYNSFFSHRLMSVALLKLSHLISGSNEILTLKLFGNLFLMFKCFEKV